jgi:hypothetical protein
MKSPIEQYLDRLEQVVGTRGQYYAITEKVESPSVWVINFDNTPEKGNLTAFAFGLSSVKHPDWKFGSPELAINVNTNNVDWALALGFLVKQYRGECPFSYGNVIRFGERIADGSEMSAFFVFAPTILDRDQAQVRLTDRNINISQAYPIYVEEIRVIEQMGAQQFFMQEDVDFCDIRRKNTGGNSGQRPD